MIKLTKEQLSEQYKYLVYKIANHFYNVEKEDLIQAGFIGLYNAYDNYKQNANTKFSTFAFKYIFGTMYKQVNSARSLKVSRDILSLYKSIELARSKLAQRLGKIPNNVELAMYLEKDVTEIDMAVLAAQEIISLDDDNDNQRSYYETIAEEQSVLPDEKIDLYDSINSLDDREQKIIRARYLKDMTQSEVAKKYNMTQVMVSRYEKKAVEKMRNYMTV